MKFYGIRARDWDDSKWVYLTIGYRNNDDYINKYVRPEVPDYDGRISYFRPIKTAAYSASLYLDSKPEAERILSTIKAFKQRYVKFYKFTLDVFGGDNTMLSKWEIFSVEIK